VSISRLRLVAAGLVVSALAGISVTVTLAITNGVFRPTFVSAPSLTPSEAKKILASYQQRYEFQDEQRVHFLARVLGSTEQHWKMAVRQSAARDYAEPKLVIFEGAIRTACGTVLESLEPAYCALDQRIYLDSDYLFTSWGGSFADSGSVPALLLVRATALHVLNQSGVLARVSARKGAIAYDAGTMRKAECLTGVWGAYATDSENFSPGEFAATVVAYRTRDRGDLADLAAPREDAFLEGFSTLDVQACMRSDAS
jgi:uncharacterized protein